MIAGSRALMLTLPRTARTPAARATRSWRRIATLGLISSAMILVLTAKCEPGQSWAQATAKPKGTLMANPRCTRDVIAAWP